MKHYKFVDLFRASGRDYNLVSVDEFYKMLTKWTAENTTSADFTICFGEWVTWKFPFTQKSYPEYFVFRRDEDATAFKLRFGL